MDYNVTYRSDLFEAGRNWEGTQVTGYEHTVMLEIETGQRFLLETSTIQDSNVVNGEVVKYNDALDITAKRVQKVIERLNAGGQLDFTYWTETYPVYGSDSSQYLRPDQIKLFMNAPANTY